MRCGHCQTENRPDVRYCEDCGAPLTTDCPTCGAATVAGKRFCGGCGTSLAPSATGRAPPEPDPVAAADASDGERKHATVLFCDIVDSTGMAERLGAEGFHSLLNSFFTAALGEVQRYGGGVVKLLGDGFMVLFGAPIAHEDHARRAVLAALGVRRRVEAAWPDSGENALRVRIGLNTGTVVVAHIGDDLLGERTAVGETMNVASRLQELAAPGEILISEATARLVQGYARLEPVGPLEVRGKRAPVAALRVLGVGPRRSPLEGLGGRSLSQFVGRDNPLAALRDLLSRALEDEGQVVGLVGEPGIGKSRLLHELRRGLSGQRVTYLEGRCLSFGSATPYLPILDLLRANCGIAVADPAPIVAEKLRSALLEIGLNGRERVPCLLQLLGIRDGTEALAGLSPEAVQAQTFDTLRQMVLAGSRERPLIAVVEDVHWIDATSEQFLGALAPSVANRPILLLTSYRPGYRPPWMELSAATQISLRQLGPADSLAVVRSVLHREEVPEALGRAILSRADGNPFFLEELARAASEEADPGAAMTVPDTVQDVLMARIDRLQDAPRRVLQTASVLGREFSLRLLEAVWPGPGSAGSHLVELERQEFVYEIADAAEPAYAFKHALTQDVAYESLLTARRRALHEAAGRALESLHSGRLEAVYDRLAHHWAQTDDSEKAVTYLTHVAEASARRYAHEEASAALRQGIEHAGRLPAPLGPRRTVELTMRLVNSLYFLGHMGESLDLLTGLQGTVEELDDPALLGPYHFWLAHTCSHLGDRHGADLGARRSLAAGERSGDEVVIGLALYALCREGWWTGRFHEGVDHGRRAVPLLERAREHWWLGHCHFFIAHSLYNMGEFDLALAEAARGGEIGEATGDPRLRSWAAWAAGHYEAERGETEEAVAQCRRAVELSPDVPNTGWALGALGFAERERGELDAAVGHLERAIEIARATSQPRIHARFTAWLSEAYLREGNLTHARELAHEALAAGRELECRWVVGHAERILGRAAALAGDPAAAERSLRAALSTYIAIDARFDTAVTHLDLARLAKGRQRADEAARHALASRRLLEALPAPRYLRLARLASGEEGGP